MVIIIITINNIIIIIFIIINGREIYREFDPNGSGDELFMVALGEKNNPRVYYKGSLLARDYLRGVKIINVFGGGEPTLNIY